MGIFLPLGCIWQWQCRFLYCPVLGHLECVTVRAKIPSTFVRTQARWHLCSTCVSWLVLGHVTPASLVQGALLAWGACHPQCAMQAGGLNTHPAGGEVALQLQFCFSRETKALSVTPDCLSNTANHRKLGSVQLDLNTQRTILSEQFLLNLLWCSELCAMVVVWKERGENR